MWSRRFRIITFVACLITLSAASLFAQEYRGRVQGTVYDSSRAAIAGATVTVTSVNTGTAATRRTEPTGHFLFDMLEPGSYTISVEFPGFSRWIQQNIALQSRADLTVDAELKAGDVRETVTVEAEAGTVQFNTSKLETTVNSKIVENMPQVYRTPFLLAQLDVSVEKTDSNADYNPYNSWGPNRQSIGGGGSYANDLLVDGNAVGLGYKTSYQPAPDMVQEVNVQQNAVDAEFGHSSGSAISLVMKSGTNDWHGDVFYQGQYPWANAIENRVNRTVNNGRNHMYGGALAHPIKKNKIFNFIGFEGWSKTDSTFMTQTLPTTLERTGDFSQSLNASGGLRTIYDPWSTKTAADGSIARTPLPGNRIPGSQIDPVSAAFVSHLWQANAPGIGNYHINNFSVGVPVKYPYKNFSDRVDWMVTDKLRVSGRFSRLRTPASVTDPTASGWFMSDRGSVRNADSYTADVVYTVTANTVVDMHGTYHSFVDSSNFSASDFKWSSAWPNSSFYSPVFSNTGTPMLIPRMSILSSSSQVLFNFGPAGGYWRQEPDGDGFNVKVAHQQGKHYLKAGFELRDTRISSTLVNNTPGFGFQADGTANTYQSPNTNVSGDGFATFLLGALQPAGAGTNSWASGSTALPVAAVQTPQSRFYGVFINDDFKVNHNLTLNMGLRYEYEQPYRDPQNRLTRPWDPTATIPEMQGANAPVAPDLVKQYYSGGWALNGAFNFASGSNPGQWNADNGTWSPRIGAAYRLNDRTSIRAAFGRYMTPWVGGNLNIFDSPYWGFNSYTDAPSAIDGVPQMRLSSPFPSTNPVNPAYGTSIGRYTELGDTFSYVAGSRPRSHSDRLNVSFQRQLPNNIVLDLTYYLNFTNQLGNTYTNYNVNQTDPMLSYTYKAALNQSVNNPFFNYLTTDKFPGPLRYQTKVNVLTLMRKYPQYGNITAIDGIPGATMRYHSLQIRAQKRFSHGYSVLIGYNFHREIDQVFYDTIANYRQTWSWQDSNNPRHRFTGSGMWEIPLGQGRKFLTATPRAVDAMIGGWNLTSVVTWRSGRYLRFLGLVAQPGNPVISNPTQGKWFDTSLFSPLPAYTQRFNPWQYPGLTAPGLFNVDASLVKSFKMTERFRAELRMDVFNAVNNVTLADPDVNPLNSTFGKATDQLANTWGRRAQLGFRVNF